MAFFNRSSRMTLVGCSLANLTFVSLTGPCVSGPDMAADDDAQPPHGITDLFHETESPWLFVKRKGAQLTVYIYEIREGNEDSVMAAKIKGCNSGKYPAHDVFSIL